MYKDGSNIWFSVCYCSEIVLEPAKTLFDAFSSEQLLFPELLKSRRDKLLKITTLRMEVCPLSPTNYLIAVLSTYIR